MNTQETMNQEERVTMYRYALRIVINRIIDSMIEDHAVDNEYTFHTYWSTARRAQLWQSLHGVGLVTLQYHMHAVAGELSNRRRRYLRQNPQGDTHAGRHQGVSVEVVIAEALDGVFAPRNIVAQQNAIAGSNSDEGEEETIANSNSNPPSPIRNLVIREEISVVEDGELREPTLVTQANVINITDGVNAEEPEGTIREEETIDEGPEETIANSNSNSNDEEREEPEETIADGNSNNVDDDRNVDVVDGQANDDVIREPEEHAEEPEAEGTIREEETIDEEPEETIANSNSNSNDGEREETEETIADGSSNSCQHRFMQINITDMDYYSIFNACDTCGNVMKKTQVRRPTLANNIAPYLYYCQACEAAMCAACGNTHNVSGRTRKKRKRG